jgi:hypothetical protein
MAGFWYTSFSWLGDDYLLTVVSYDFFFVHARKRERKLSGISSDKSTNPILEDPHLLLHHKLSYLLKALL